MGRREAKGGMLEVKLNTSLYSMILNAPLEGWNMFYNMPHKRKKWFIIQPMWLNSYIMDSPEGSVIQGSEMSGNFYNLYVNEIPDIHKLINRKIFKKITNKNTQKK